jgi:hypothetical protein
MMSVKVTGLAHHLQSQFLFTEELPTLVHKLIALRVFIIATLCQLFVNGLSTTPTFISTLMSSIGMWANLGHQYECMARCIHLLHFSKLTKSSKILLEYQDAISLE